MDGIKTGYTRASGFNLVSSVKTDNKHIVAAVFGGKTAAARNAHMRMLLYRALEGASTERTRKGSQMLVASARPVIKQTAVETMDVAWSTETKSTETKAPKKAAEKPVKPPAKAAAKVPPPTPAVRPAPPQVAAERSAPPAGRDQIAQVLSNSAPPSAPPGNGGTVVAAAQPLASPPRLDLEALREAMSEENEPQGDASATAAAPPVQASAAPGPQDIASLIRNSIVEGAPTARTLPNPQADAATARPPSTLDSQASALTAAYRAPAQDTGSLRVADAGRTASPPPGLPPSHLQGPQAARAPAGSAYEIQIGAYSTAVEAQTKLEAVRTRANALLQGHTGVTIPVQRADRQMYRARFVNFNEQAASNTCLELRRLAIDCFVMKAE
jgi:D-alanyl-D-alanine carboxypeptidase